MVLAAAKVTEGLVAFPPIDPIAVAARLGANVAVHPGARKPDGTLEDHGRLSVRNKRWHITVPFEMSAERRRFSIAHEVGHILLYEAVAAHPAEVQELRSRPLWRQIEQLCNQGAAAILMPAESFQRAAEKAMPPTATAVEALAKRFRVSLEAAARRIAELVPDWSVMFWEHRSDHRRGPAWRTARHQHRGAGPFLPHGLSSGRLKPDVVREAGENGLSMARVVVADLPGAGTMVDAYAWLVRTSRPELPDFDSSIQPARHPDRVFMFYRGTEAERI